MSTVALAKPGSIAGNVVVAADIGVDSGDDFQIKVRDWEPDFYTTVAPTMGDADSVPQYEHNGLLYQRGLLSGWMIANRSIGLANLVSQTKNPLEATMKLFCSSQNTFTFKICIDRIRFRFNREGPFVPMSFTYFMHDTTVASIEAQS